MAAVGTGIESLLAQAAAAAPKFGSLNDIEHVVIFMQENRSFDHYFGTLSGIRGFGDKRGRRTFYQRGQGGETLHPFRLHTGCVSDIKHSWGPQHMAWNGGKMNRFLAVHEQVDVPSVDGSPAGSAVETMGYYTRRDLPFYYALADAFTVCDAYHCSVLGPTYPNRLMSISATIDPAGTHGGAHAKRHHPRLMSAPLHVDDDAGAAPGPGPELEDLHLTGARHRGQHAAAVHRMGSRNQALRTRDAADVSG
jgi:phospholipase C